MANPAQSDVLTVERSGHVATVWLDRPDKLNAFGHEAWNDLPVVMHEVGDDPTVRVVIIAAKGKAFTVGLDLVAFGPSILGGVIGDAGSDASELSKRRATYDQIKTMQRTISAVAECPKPVIAAVHGYCLGAGVDLITACDIRLASADAVFSVRETKMAMVADVGTLQRLPSIVDPGRVAELVYTGKDFGAEEAAEMGLVSHVYADAATLMKHAMEMAEDIATNSPLAVQGSKAVLRAAAGKSADQALDYVALWNAAFLHSDDLTEALHAFSDKRNPSYRGE